jgi:hypothetical protein
MRILRLFAALLVPCFAAYVWLAPGYLEPDIPVAKHKGGMGFWLETHRTQLTDVDVSGVMYVHRQFGFTTDAHEWKSEAEVFAYFEERLTKLGWKFSVAGIHDGIAPESYLLGPDNHKMYYRPGDRHRTRLTLSVWRRGAPSDYFNVALTTATPSLRRRIWEFLDD